jgi:hypothetical protein
LLRAANAIDRDALALAERSAGIGVWRRSTSRRNRVRGTAQVLSDHGFFLRAGTHDSDFFPPVEDDPRASPSPKIAKTKTASWPAFRQALDGGDDSYEIRVQDHPARRQPALDLRPRPG